MWFRRQSKQYATALTLSEPARLVWPTAWAGHIPFAFWLVENTKPRTFVELGTHTGNSFCAFLQAANVLRTEGRAYQGGDALSFTAIDHWVGDEHAGFYGDDIYDELRRFIDDNLPDGRLLRSSFDNALTNFENGSIDILHIDGLHTYEAVKHDFETWLPKLSSRGVVLLHDISVREAGFGVYQFFGELEQRYPTVAFEHSSGLGVVAVGKAIPPGVQFLIENGSDEVGMPRNSYFARVGNALVDRFNSEKFLKDLLEVKADRDKLTRDFAEIEADRNRIVENLKNMT